VAGAGVAGLTAAWALASRRVGVTLVEQRPVVGGWASGYGCKAGTECTLCAVCLASASLRRLNPPGRVLLQVDTSVIGIEGEAGRFTVRLRRGDRGVDTERCTGCGLCAQVCPTGAIRQPHPQAMPLAYAIDRERCLRAGGEACERCREACPFDAIQLDVEEREESVRAGVVIMATGFTPFEASRRGQFGYGRLPGVITTMDLEQGLWEQGSRYLEQVAPGCRRVAFVHCVGSRDTAIGRGWCSQVCCPTALRLAARLVREIPGLEVSLFYMDLQRCAPGIAALYGELPEAVKLVRGTPAWVQSGPGGLVVTFEDLTTAARLQEAFDVIVLAVGMDPPAAVSGLPVHVNGHAFLEDLPPGVVTAGACAGPLSIADAVADGLRAAGSALGVLAGQP